VISEIGNRSVDLGELFEFAVSAFDPDNHNLSFSVVNLPAGASFDAASRTFLWRPADNDDVGNHQVIFTVTDDGDPNLNDSKEVTITVGETNRPPVFGSIGDKVVAAEQLLVFAVTATDPDNDELEFSAHGLSPGAVFDESSQLFYWVPTNHNAGLNILKFVVTDNGTPPLSSEIIVDIEVGEAAAAGNDSTKQQEADTPEQPTEIVVKGGSSGGCFIRLLNSDEVVKSRNSVRDVIPAKAGIQ
jgi:hypothetical protein